MTDVSKRSEILGNDRVKKLGKTICEGIVEGQDTENEFGDEIKEIMDDEGVTSKEDLQFGDNSALYATAVAGFVEKELRSELVSKGIIKKLNLPDGADKIDVPKGSNLTASAVSSDGSITTSGSDYGSATISTDLYGTEEQFTHELLQVTNIDVIADRLEEIGRSLAKKEDDLILSELQDATDPTSSYSPSDNHNYLGSDNYVGYDELVEAIHDAKGNKMQPTDIIVGTTVMKKLEQDSDFKKAASYATSEGGDIINRTMTFRGLNVHESSNVSGDSLFIVDRDKLGYFVEGSDVETWDDRINGKAAFEVLGVKRFGVGIARVNAVYGLHQDEATPT